MTSRPSILAALKLAIVLQVVAQQTLTSAQPNRARQPAPNRLDPTAPNRLDYENRDGLDFYNAFIADRRRAAVASSLNSILPAASPIEEVSGSLGRVVVGRRTAKQLAQDAPEAHLQNKLAGENICLTSGCVRAAADILKNIDERVDPCEDFYRYSCGNWIDSQVIPEDKTSVSLFSVVQDELDAKLRNLIERPSTASDPPIVQKMRNLYESCMNTSKFDTI